MESDVSQAASIGNFLTVGIVSWKENSSIETLRLFDFNTKHNGNQSCTFSESRWRVLISLWESIQCRVGIAAEGSRLCITEVTYHGDYIWKMCMGARQKIIVERYSYMEWYPYTLILAYFMTYVSQVGLFLFKQQELIIWTGK